MKLVRGSEIEFVGASHEDPKQPGVFKRVLATREQVLPGRVQMINWAKLPQGSRFQRHRPVRAVCLSEPAADWRVEHGAVCDLSDPADAGPRSGD